VTHDAVAAVVRQWLESLVIELNLCPFAGRELLNNRVRFAVTDATTEDELLNALRTELELLDADTSIETILLIHPEVLCDFAAYNQFLDAADGLLRHLEMEGIYQIASFHPDYQFGGTEPNDVENFTNRAPYPLLHILREESLERAIAEFPDVEQIPERNIKLMNSMGKEQLQRLWQALNSSA
jgi:hypothetical protein